MTTKPLESNGRTCKKCKHFLPKRDSVTGRILPKQFGECSVVISFPLLPICYVGDMPRRRSMLGSNDATKCHFFSGKK